MKSRTASFVVMLATLLLPLYMPASGALASAATGARGAGQVASLPAPVSQTPVRNTPDVYAGSCGQACGNISTVYATALVGSEVVVGGAFTRVCTPAAASYGHCPSQVTADFVFAYDPVNGTLDPHFAAVLNGPVYSLAAGQGSTVYLGGSFTTVNGKSTGGLAALHVTPGDAATDGQLVRGFHGRTPGIVNALAYEGGALYVGGQFTRLDNKPEKIARLNASTGALDSSFQFTISDPVQGHPLKIKTMAVSPDGSSLAIGGTFQQVDGLPRPRLALIDTGGGLGKTAALANWSAPLLSNNCAHQHDYLNDIAFSPDGSYFVIADSGFQPVGGPGICDAAARFETGATGSVQPTWINYTGGDSLDSAVVTGSVVYVGGHQRWTNNECGSNHVCEANAILVNGLAAIDASTGLGLPYWHPQTARGAGILSLTALPAGAFRGSDGDLIVGTNVDNIAGAIHHEMAMFPETATAAPTPGGPIESGMFTLGRLNAMPGQGGNTGTAAECVDDANDSGSPGSPVELVTCQNDPEQNWTIKSGLTIEINGLCLDTQGGATSPGSHVVVASCTGAASQKWRAGAASTLVNKASGLCLDDPGNSTASGVQLEISTCSGSTGQSWPLPVAAAPPSSPPTGPVYPEELRKDDTICLTDSGGGTAAGNPVQMATCLGQRWQDWTAESDRTIRYAGHCLDTQGGGTSSGTVVVLDPCNGKPTQTWTPQADHLLRNGVSGLCLDILNVSKDTQPVVWPCSGNTISEQWRLPAN